MDPLRRDVDPNERVVVGAMDRALPEHGASVEQEVGNESVRAAVVTAAALQPIGTSALRGRRP